MIRERGFSYLELILVVAILLVLGGLTTSFYSRFLTQNSVQNTTDMLSGQLRKAQIYAMSGKQNTSWGVSYSSHTITLFKTADASFNENYVVNSNITISGLTTLTFSKITGLPDSTPTITIVGNSQTKTVTVNSQGVVSK